jgi:serine protease Do
MKFLKVLGGLVVLAGIVLAVRVSGRDWQGSDPSRELSVLAGRGAEIGVSIRDAEPRQAEADGSPAGVVVDEVRPDSPADKAGIKRSDIIVGFDGERVRSARQFSRLVQETAPGRRVTATIVRDGKKSEVQLTPERGRNAWLIDGDRLGDRMREGMGDLRMFSDRMPQFNFDVDHSFPGPLSRARLGVTVEELSSQLAGYFGVKEGLLVSSVTDDSAAAHAGIKAGDVITAINGERTRSSEDLVRAIRDLNDGEVKIDLVRDKKTMSVTAKIEARKPIFPAMSQRVRGGRPA